MKLDEYNIINVFYAITTIAVNTTPIIPTAIANPLFPYVAYPLLLEVLLAEAVEPVPVAELPVVAAADPVSVREVAEPTINTWGKRGDRGRGWIPVALGAEVSLTTTVDVPLMTETDSKASGPPLTIVNCPDCARIPVSVTLFNALNWT